MRSLLAGVIASVAFVSPALAADVTVTLTGVKAKGGTVRVVLYDEKTFLRAAPPFSAEAKGTAKGDVVVVLHDVPAGEYAIAAMHDADDNHIMTPGPNGPMGEGTAMSNGDALRGMPTFAVTKVAVPATGAAFRLPMSYPEDRSGW